MAEIRRFRSILAELTFNSPAAGWDFSPTIGGVVLQMAPHGGLP